MTGSAAASMRGRDYLDVADLSADELRAVLDLAHAIKAGDDLGRPLQGRYVAMVFQKPSHRTRVSFEVGIGRLGGTPITLGEQDVQIGARESIEDAAHVLDEYVDGIVARLRHHGDLRAMAVASCKPVINALTEVSHPCQILADLMTLEELFGSLRGLSVAYVGDGNNVAASLMEAAALVGLRLTVVTPAGYGPPEQVLAGVRRLGPEPVSIVVTTDLDAVGGSAAVYTDVWTSMGQETERENRRRDFAGYQVTEALMERTPDARFLHCLPAHRGEEVAAGVIDGPRSVVFQQAGNRLHAQMALMALLMPG